MKIIYFANIRVPTEKAHGLQIMKMMEAFCQAGVDGRLIFSRRPEKTLSSSDPFLFYNLKRRFPLVRLYSFDPSSLLMLPQGFYVKVQALFFIIAIFLYLLFRKNKREDVFYTREEYLLPVLLIFSRRVVWEAHGLPRRVHWYLPFWRRLEAIVALSQGLKKDLMAVGLAGKKIVVAPDGVDPADFNATTGMIEARRALGWPEDKKIILYAGQLYPWKGADVLAAAAQIMPGRFFVFAGGLGGDLIDFKKRYQRQKNILIVGQRPHGDIPLYLRAADVLVLPNSSRDRRSSFWTSPLKLFEYLASGRPVVASDLPSIREVLDEQSAILVAPDNPEALARGLEKVLTDEDLVVKIVAQGLRIIKSYSWKQRAVAIINFINNEYV